ncbi:hypothetical protein N0V82_004023 [Gnomoniopsis sp. IMI 355080]|nr:hypothetical protein N0V82_004023 [Gnomoniopsis sp. IMI 355080]
MPSDNNEPTSPAKEDVVASSTMAEEAADAPSAASTEEAAVAAKEDEKPESQSAPSPADSRSEEGEARSDDSPEESDERAASGRDGNEKHTTTAETDNGDAQPPLPNEPTPGDGDAPPLPAEAPPGQQQQVDDGWSAEWDATNQTWYFYNRFTGVSQWDNPRQPTAAAAAAASQQPQISQPTSIAGGYNPAIHGSWDPNAPYAQAYKDPDADGTTGGTTTTAAADEAEYQADLAMYHAEMQGADPTAAAAGFEEYGAVPAAFNRRTGKTQAGDQNPERYSDANKSYRQMNAYFNVDQAANSHDGRSLKAERRGKQPTRKELSMWKEKRKARKEEKRRAWLRD